MLTILTAGTIDLDTITLQPLRWGSQGETEACLRAFLASLTAADTNIGTYEGFEANASQNKAMRDACAKVAGINRDKATVKVQVATKANGKTTWRNLRKNESKGNRDTREVTLHAYSTDARKAGVEKIREMFGVTLAPHPVVSSSKDGYTAYAFVKVANVS